MRSQHSQKSHEELAFEFLAHQSQVSVEEVARLYANELSRLRVGAHITCFLPILAIRKVREILHVRLAARLIAA